MSQFLKHEGDIPPDAYLLSQVGHLVLDHFESSSVLSAGFYFLMTNDRAMSRLQHELRSKFQSLEGIDDEALQELPWLNATIEEILRLHTNVPYGLPRISPGYTVDKDFIAKGVIFLLSFCAMDQFHTNNPLFSVWSQPARTPRHTHQNISTTPTSSGLSAGFRGAMRSTTVSSTPINEVLSVLSVWDHAIVSGSPWPT